MFSNIIMLDYRKPLSERAKQRKIVGNYRWQPTKAGNSRGFYQSQCGLRCDEAGSTFDLRLDYAVNHIETHLSYRKPVGYYSDLECDETLTPIIARLPHSRGFLAGYTAGPGMWAAIEPELHETAQEAALAAHEAARIAAARIAAEREREHQEAEQLKAELEAEYEAEKSELVWFSTGSGRIELQISREDAASGSHQGQCDDDIAALRELPYIAEQLAKIDRKLLVGELKEYGAWTLRELVDHDQNLSRLLWLACGDIVEEAFNND